MRFFVKISKISAIVNEHFEIRERCKGVHCVDLGESIHMSLLFKFSFFSLSPCPFFSIFFSNQIAIQTSIYYLVVACKFGVDTAEIGPLKVCQKML